MTASLEQLPYLSGERGHGHKQEEHVAISKRTT